MYKYKCFEEYIQINYLEVINEELCNYIINESQEFKFNKPCDFLINSIKVNNVNFTLNRVNNVKFLVSFSAEFLIINKSNEKTLLISDDYCVEMSGSFKDGFNLSSGISKCELINNCERLSNGLVPIIYDDELDEYASKFLEEVSPSALISPTRLDIASILKSNGITVHFAPLENHVFGKTFFANDNVTVYDHTIDYNLINVKVTPGTIIINFDKHLGLNDDVYRNTVVHELVHWFFHRNYFELRQLLDNTYTCTTCYKSDSEYENEEISQMEYQARALAPRILMPKEMFLNKYREYENELNSLDKYKKQSKNARTKTLISKLSAFFGASKASVKIRLCDLLDVNLDGINNFVDGSYIESFSFENGKLLKNQTFVVNNDELSELIQTNLLVRDSLFSGKLLYINKMLVINNPKYVNREKCELTRYALNHADECCFIFNVSRKTETTIFDYKLARTSDSSIIRKEIDSVQAYKVIQLVDDSSKHFESHKKYLPQSFSETLEYHYKKAKENNLYSSYEDLAFDCDISEKTLANYVKGYSIPNRINVIKICLTLRLSSPYIIDMLTKADCIMSNNNAINNVLWTIIFGYQRIGIEKIFYELKKINKSYILEMSDKWIENHT